MSKLEMTVFDGDFFYTTGSKEVIFFGRWKVFDNCRIRCAILKWNKGGQSKMKKRKIAILLSALMLCTNVSYVGIDGNAEESKKVVEEQRVAFSLL